MQYNCTLYPLISQMLGLDSPSGLVQHSRIEIVIAHELKALLSLDIDDHVVGTSERTWTVDIKIPHLDLVVEYDSAYYHSGRESIDRKKADSLTNAGWHVIRCRESPLEELAPYGVVVPPKNVKKVTDILFARIEESCAIKIPGLANYLSSSFAVFAIRRSSDRFIYAASWLNWSSTRTIFRLPTPVMPRVENNSRALSRRSVASMSANDA